MRLAVAVLAQGRQRGIRLRPQGGPVPQVVHVLGRPPAPPAAAPRPGAPPRPGRPWAPEGAVPARRRPGGTAVRDLPGSGRDYADNRRRSPWTPPAGRPLRRPSAGLTAHWGTPTLTVGTPTMTDPADLPQGTVTFLFTDLEGSTKLLEARPAAYRDAVRRHHDLLKGAVERHGGVVFETVGDAVYAAFARSTDAGAAALEGQLALQAEAWGELGPGALRARMALHTGEVERAGGALLRDAPVPLRPAAGDGARGADGGLLGHGRARAGRTLRGAPARSRGAPAQGPGPAGAGVPVRPPGAAGGLPASAIAGRAPAQPAGPAHATRRPGGGATARARGAPARRRAPGDPDRPRRHGQDASGAATGGGADRGLRRRRVLRARSTRSWIRQGCSRRSPTRCAFASGRGIRSCGWWPIGSAGASSWCSITWSRPSGWGCTSSSCSARRPTSRC